MRRAERLGTLALLGLAHACASPAGTSFDGPGPSDAHVAALEAELASDTASVDAKIRLGAAYATSDRPEEAFPLLWDATVVEPSSAPALFYLGTTYEQLQQFQQARVTYERFLALGPPANVAATIEDRLPWIRREELQAEVSRALALEDSLVADPAPHSIGVFPFVYQGTEPAFEPLGRALAHMLTTDLGQIDRITVLERVQTQMMLDELRMSELHYVDATTAARGGRIMGAGRIVQGRIEGSDENIAVEAAVVPVEAPGEARSVSESDASASLFELEARLALAIVESLGVELAPAERDRIARAPTSSLPALLAFGRGLVAMDRGDFATATAEMGAAAQLDPGFTEAQTLSAEAAAMQGAAATSADQVASVGLGTLVEGAAGDQAVTAQATSGLDARRDLYREIEQIIPDVTGRDPVAEVTGLEGFGRGAPTLDVIIRRPARLR